eukprot:5323225-Alexandrium_andersonii.AAC.1
MSARTCTHIWANGLLAWPLDGKRWLEEGRLNGDECKRNGPSSSAKMKPLPLASASRVWSCHHDLQRGDHCDGHWRGLGTGWTTTFLLARTTHRVLK